MKYANFFLGIAILLFFGTSCTESERLTTSAVKVGNNLGKTTLKLSDIMRPTSIVVLDEPTNHSLRSISKIIYAENNNIIILDVGSDFRTAYLYDPQGSFVGVIGDTNKAEPHDIGLMDVSVFRDEVTLLGAGKRSFFNYRNNGLDSDPLTFATASIGDKLERDAFGNYILYNEHSGTNVSGNNYLVVYDNAGNLIKRMYPYNSSRENLSYEYTGFLLKSGKSLWFSPPFDNTIYEVTASKLSPIMHFDFEQANVPIELIDKKISGSETLDYGFIGEWFVKHGSLIQLEYFYKGRIHHGFFDESSGLFYNTNSFQVDALSKLYQRCTIMPRDESAFVMVLRSEQIGSLYKDGLIDQENLNAMLPGLGDELMEAGTQNKPVLVTFQYHNGAGLR